MIDIIERMATERLWIYTALVGSLFGLAFSTYFKGTRAGMWLYGKFDTIINFLVERWGWTWFKKDPNAWRKVHQELTKHFDEMEARLDNIEGDDYPKFGGLGK